MKGDGPQPHLFPHQREALAKIKNGSIVWGGVGTGKSRVGLAYYINTENYETLYIITTAKKRDNGDWIKEYAPFGLGVTDDSSVAGRVVVDSWNNVAKYKDVKDAFFIFDEQRVVGWGKWSKAFVKIARNNRWILLSATPGDNWLDYAPAFIAHGFYRNITQFKDEHVLYEAFTTYPKVKDYQNINKLVRQRNEILVHMPYLRQTTRHPHNVWVEFDEDKMHKATVHRWNVFEDYPIRDISELFAVMRRIVNGDTRRIDALNNLLGKHPRLIVFYNFNYELDAMREGLVPWIQQAEWNGHKHEELPETEEWVYLVQYAAGAEGWNCVSTDSIAFYSLPYSYKLWEQAHGRIDRLNTPYKDLHYFYLRSKASIDLAIWTALKRKRSFTESGSWQGSSQIADVSAKS